MSNVIKFPDTFVGSITDISEIDKQYLVIEKQSQEIEKQKKLIKEMGNKNVRV